MELSLLMEMHQNIDAYVQAEVFRDKYVVIFGSNESAEKMMDYLAIKNVTVNGIVDNDARKDGTSLYGVPVMLPDNCLIPKKDNCVILIASRYYPEMVMQLEAMGYQEKKEIFKAAEYSTHNSSSLTEEKFEERIQIVKRGEELFRKVFEREPGTEKIFVCPPAELGATYVGMAYIRQYTELHRISKFHLIIRNGAYAKLAYLFGFENDVTTLQKDEMEAFLQFAVFTDMAGDKILIMNHRHPYTCRLGEIGNYKGIHFIDHFQYSIFRFGKPIKPEIPYIHRDNKEAEEYVEELFINNQLKRGKTVILMPYANTAPKIDLNFWEKLAERLRKEGYIVCTNSSGEAEPSINGTIPLFYDLRYALEVTEKAGYMIALRSGMCDVLSSAKAKKIIIYPNRIYGPGSFMEFYHLGRLGLSDDAVELLWKDDWNDILENVITEMT